MSIYALSSFSVVVLGCILISIILRNHRNYSSRILAFFLFILTYTNFVQFLFEAGYVVSESFLFRTTPLVFYLIPPSIFLYIIFVARKRVRLHWSDSIHLVPALIYLIDFLPFFISSSEFRQQLPNRLLEDPGSMLYFKHGFLFSAGTHFAVRACLVVVYTVLQIKVIFGLKNSDEATAIKRDYINWLIILSLLCFVFSIYGLLTFLFLAPTDQWIPAIINNNALLFVVSVLLFFKPYILYRMPHNRLWAIKNEKDKQSTHNLSVETITELKLVFQNFVQNQHYLRNDISIKEVAAELHTRPYILSAFINETYQVHFNDLINNYRIQYIRDGLASGKWGLLTLEAIAENAGFNNRTTFLSAFKKFTGLTPTQFIKKINVNKIKDLPSKANES